MKKQLAIILMISASSSFAMDAEQLKKTSMEACKTQSEQVPVEMRPQMIEACECSVKKTDYDAVLGAQKAGDTEKLQADALKVAQECAAELS